MTHQEKLKHLKEGFVKYSRADLEQFYAQELLDWAETDTRIREKCAGILKDKEINGDSFGVPTVEVLVDKLVNEVKYYKSRWLDRNK